MERICAQMQAPFASQGQAPCRTFQHPGVCCPAAWPASARSGRPESLGLRLPVGAGEAEAGCGARFPGVARVSPWRQSTDYLLTLNPWSVPYLMLDFCQASSPWDRGVEDTYDLPTVSLKTEFAYTW